MSKTTATPSAKDKTTTALTEAKGSEGSVGASAATTASISKESATAPTEAKGGKEKNKVKIPDGSVGEPVSFKTPNEGHRLWIELKGGKPVVMVASTPEQAENKLNKIVDEIHRLSNLPPQLLAKADELLRRGYGLLNVTVEQIDQRLTELQTSDSNINIEDIRAEIDKRAKSVPQRNALAHVFQELFEILYNATHLPDQRNDGQALAWYHGQMREAMGSKENNQDTSGFSANGAHRLPSMLGAVVDQENNKQAYFGMSAGGKEQPNKNRLDNAHPELRDKLNSLNSGKPLNRELTNCAEFEGYDKALCARGGDNANFERLNDSAAWGEKEELKYEPRCENCEYLYGAHQH